MRFGMFFMPSHPPERALHDAIEWDLQCIRWADELGFDEAWMGEHHTLDWEPVVAPDLVLAQAIQQTEHIRLGTAGLLMAYMHPATLANRISQLDHMAKGRLNFAATISSAPTDHAFGGIAGGMDQSRRMTAEATELAVKVWTSEEPFSFRGEFWSCDYDPAVAWLRPYQKPHPPIAVPGLGPASASIVNAGAKGYSPISFNVAERLVETHWPAYEEGAASTGRTADRRQWHVLKDIFVAETDEEARRWSVESYFARFYTEYHLPLLDSIGLKGHLKEDESLPDSAIDIDYLADTCFIIGSPDTVVEKITRLYERLGGFGTLMLLSADYADAPERWHRSLELLATEVAPRLAHLDGTPLASTTTVGGDR
ncbi:MAG: LLM class flavin-dependent oxidoreductase [Actinobacteria bacterium]|nr:LLM class flavin-dependent oxidoreductase [Actinomycetota bacterium]